MQDNKVYLIFYQPDMKGKPWQERFASKLQDLWEGVSYSETRFNHVELVVRVEGKDKNGGKKFRYITYGIDKQGMHRIEYKFFTNPGYKAFYILSLGNKSFNTCVSLLDRTYNNNPTYDHNVERRMIPLGLGKLLKYTPGFILRQFGLTGNELLETKKIKNTFFCSELICMVLKHAGVIELQTYNPLWTTTHMLYLYAQKNLKHANEGDIPFLKKKFDSGNGNNNGFIDIESQIYIDDQHENINAPLLVGYNK
jgi:hypothetical protein